jgi:hypothetical protein
MESEFVNWIVFDEGDKKYLIGSPRVRLDDPNDRPRHAKLLVANGYDGTECNLKRFICSLSWSLVELWEVEEDK